MISTEESVNTSAVSSNGIDKYEWLTGEDLEYKPGVAKQAKV